MENKTMDNNKSNYQEYTFTQLLEQYDKILVPMIQRDYAQGRTDKKATDVRNNLLTDIFSDKDVHFDLVFGSKEKRIIDGKEMNCFIPVDGQQRLTTLFLLYLYGQKAGKTITELDLSKFSYDTRRAASDFCKGITSKEWAVQNGKKVSDVIKDSSWFMNYWEKDPTVEGMLNMLDAIHEKCKDITDYPDLRKVTFYFFDLESNGLNENLYLKMNSRGKPLTAFENLKAKMEKILPENVEFEDKCFPNCDASPKDSFKAKWKHFMDRNWTEAFWDMEHPEKYDESITKFIVRFLAGYWAAYGTDEEQMANDLKSLNSKDSYADFIPFEPIKKVLDLENAFPKLAYALTTITDNSKIKPYWSHEKEEIEVSNKSEYKILAVVFTYVLFNGDEAVTRFAWNMAENYVTGYDTFVTYCKRAREIHKFKCSNNVTFHQTLSSIEFVGNTSDQMKEEIAKAKQILNKDCELCKKYCKNENQTWEDAIKEAESYAFFKGAIRFLFIDGEGNINWCDFDTKWANAKSLIPLNKENLQTIELLIPFMADDDLKDMFSKFNLSNEDKNLKALFLDSPTKVHNFFMQQNKNEKSSNLQEDLLYHCEQHPKYWIHKKWENGFDILSDYERKNGYYDSNSYIVGNVFFISRLNILKQIKDINISNIQNLLENDNKIWKGLFIEFEYNNRKFRWQLNDWVDMYNDKMENLWEKGLHSHYKGREEHSFSDLDSLKKELDRCCSEYELII